ncbi:phage tail sheath family protein [Rhodohalobacter sp. 8-1]|uniref:phage tail sheath family protein n=1 Tax=Rhodohalobacter sp. 8-1 TaxID=3131972 RepID=UPI0030EB859C
MPDYKTPGVYIEEISTLPASVAAVATAIPAFVGYTQKKERNGETILDATPVRITSMLEYQEIFGMPFDEQYAITLSPNPDDPDITDISIPEPSGVSPYLLYYQLQMFYANGGGPCHVVSVGTYVDAPASSSDISVGDLEAGITALEQEDEPTLLVVPEAVHLDSTDRTTIHNQLLAQCNKLQDRFAIMDALANPDTNTVVQDAAAFRDEVGTSNLKYGASYYPSLKTSLNRYYNDASVLITDNRPTAGEGPYHLSSLKVIGEGDNYAVGQISFSGNDVVGDVFDIDGETFEAVASEGDDPVTGDHGFVRGSGPATTAASLLEAIREAGNENYTAERSAEIITLTATAEGTAGAGIVLTYTDNGGGEASVSGNGTFEIIDPDKTLYNRIKNRLDRSVELYPSGAMAGIYARVDRQRGVWKAPANVSVNRVREPGLPISSQDQEGLNVDATTGKSINAIRQFAGKGTMVWGARTLAGNDNEWRYIPVRRLFIFVEESIEKATEFVVFEPNDAKTWLRVKSMIENFLAKLWRDGALAGATPDEAFFVKVGLGQTMTPLDILEGRMIIEVGLAAVRPAEFIILKFSHKLQES